VGEAGVRLSGGQRQRIGIARALYHDPSVLIFDEGTSALDGPTEQQVMRTLNKLRGTRTIIVVAHRLSTVQSCDRIVVLHQGAVSAVGSYQELVESSERFRDMTRASQGPPPATHP
jgi:ABC-type multidrug transport system fused ATPase/permease subunit